jgi:RNA recognition motif-containing protein
MLEHFSTVGQVLSFTIHYDRETGRPKGTGECVFRDAAVAESAIANLNGSVFRDNVLRVSRDQADRAPGGPFYCLFLFSFRSRLAAVLS